MFPTDTKNPDHYHKVVDCQWACPAHTPVPEYIRLISRGRYDDAYMVNWESNVFPGVLGRVCDRPCETACRRGRVEEQPVAICRLKRVAADNKGTLDERFPKPPEEKNGKHVALIGGGPASLTVARDLLLEGYDVSLFERGQQLGGMMRSDIPSFRLPQNVLDEEIDVILKLGVDLHSGVNITSLKDFLERDFDAVFVGTGAPRGRNLTVPGREEAAANIHMGIDWLSQVAFEHVENIGKRVVVLGGGNTAMDCCRTARRLGGENVTVVVRSGYDEMKASDWEKEEAEAEGIPMLDYRVPKEFLHENGKLTGVRFEIVRKELDKKGRRKLVPTGEPDEIIECDDVLLAVGQENSFPWIERDIGLEFNEWDMPVVDEVTFASSKAGLFFGGDAAFGPKNIITAVAHGHQAAISIDLFCQGEAIEKRPERGVTLASQRMGMHDWSYNSEIHHDHRFKVPMVEQSKALSSIKIEVELGFDPLLGHEEAMRCLNCDVQTVFEENLCIECDSCVDVCPMDCISFVQNGEEDELRTRLRAPAENKTQSLLISEDLKTGRVMVKDENVCLHCGFCAERCPTSAWDMQQSIISIPQASCRSRS
ncbi:MAG: glutamate synthase [Gammaproteobacteria bacterium]|nr:MAG: glutamate synthase [Gammaproteobacteria bacterium]